MRRAGAAVRVADEKPTAWLFELRTPEAMPRAGRRSVWNSVIPDLVSDRRERRVSGIHAGTWATTKPVEAGTRKAKKGIAPLFTIL
ncbi:hypothetical protein QV13_10940 [Mesorhizobium hungaricum]|jgi:hypothetical protein|uniref:Uncharacterized protein n=1 Tax=Mesorhizobium hungaricum TaxID=1566387 RepID=A0A1C2DVC5_9HYPH|nr:hypothetical protein QV13_10940 [Mesorhizobium hungaricum]